MVVAHKSSSDEIGVLRKLFEKYASHAGSISFERFRQVMSEHSDQEELRLVFDAMVSQVFVMGVCIGWNIKTYILSGNQSCLF